MTNAYFNYTDPVAPGDRLESNKYNNDFGAIAKAFDSLPSPEELATNTKNYAVSTGTATAYQVTLPSFEGSFGYIEGMQIIMRAHVTNTGPATLSINNGTPVAMKNFHTGTGPAYNLVAGDLASGIIYSLRYDGTQFQVVNTVATALASSQAAAQTAQAAANTALTAQQNAGTSASNAAGSASSAAGSAATAQNASLSAFNSANAAAGSASAAAGSASAAAGSATTATNAASAASASATTATNAATTATNAAGTASTAATNAAASDLSATNAAAAAANSAAIAQAALTDPAFKNAVMNILLTTNVVVGATKFYASTVDPNTLYPGTTWTKLPAAASIRTALADGSDVMTQDGNDNVTLVTANLPSHGHTGTITIQQFAYPQLNTSTKLFSPQPSSQVTFPDATTSTYVFGTIATGFNNGTTQTSSNSGAHSHTINVSTGSGPFTSNISGFSSPQPSSIGTNTQTNGNHTHTVTFPAHNHSVSIPDHSHTATFQVHSHSTTIADHNHTLDIPGHDHTVTPVIQNAGNGSTFSVKNASVKLVGWRRTA